MKKASCIYGIFVGVCMIGMWSMLLATGQAVELKTEPYSMAAHLTVEFLTAVLLIIGGTAVLLKKVWGKILHYVSLGALSYAVIMAGGYYMQEGNSPMAVMFGCLFAATLFFIAAAVGGSKNTEMVYTAKKI